MRVLIRKLTRTFLTLSLEDVGRRAVVSGGSGGDIAGEAERVVLEMIAGGGICAKINQKDGMVKFLDGLGGGDTNRVLEMIEGKVRGNFILWFLFVNWYVNYDLFVYRSRPVST